MADLNPTRRGVLVPDELKSKPLYSVKRRYEGCYEIIDNEDGERVARVAKFMPGPMISVSPSITSPALARAIAKAMTRLAGELERHA